MERPGPIYDKVLAALTAAHEACFKANSAPLGMTHGPFSGVNRTLGAVNQMELALRLVVLRDGDERSIEIVRETLEHLERHT